MKKERKEKKNDEGKQEVIERKEAERERGIKRLEPSDYGWEVTKSD
jgi:hypothetical protein